MSEQRYQAVLAVIKDGETVVSVAARFGVSRKTVHQWLSRYEADGLEGLADRSHRPRSSPLQMPAVVEVALVDLRRRHPSWGPRRLVYELARAGVEPVPSESGAYRALLRFGLIDPAARRPRDRKWKRWERGAAMELWQHRALRTEFRTDQGVFASLARLPPAEKWTRGSPTKSRRSMTATSCYASEDECDPSPEVDVSPICPHRCLAEEGTSRPILHCEEGLNCRRPVSMSRRGAKEASRGRP